MVRRLRARRESHRRRAQDGGHARQQVEQLLVPFDRDRRAAERGNGQLGVGERDQGMERPDLGPGCHGRGQDLGA